MGTAFAFEMDSVDSNTLHAASAHIGQHCAAANKAFMECKARDGHPAACLKQGEDVTQCALDLLTRLQACQQTMNDFAGCLDKNNKKMYKCRREQDAFNKCAQSVLPQ